MNKPARLLILASLSFIGLSAVAADAPPSPSALTKPISAPSFIKEQCHDYLCSQMRAPTSSETSSPLATTDVGNPVPDPTPRIRPFTSIDIDSTRDLPAR